MEQPAASVTDNETATLFSKEPNHCEEVTSDSAGDTDESEAFEELTSCTDVSFKEPPSTAVRWTATAFDDLEPGGTRTSVGPPHASREDSWAIKDAHISAFAIHPSTRAHTGPDERPLFIAPEGELRALVDYRVETPDGEDEENFTQRWSVSSQEVREVRVLRDGETVATAQGSQTPVLEYATSGSGQTEVTLEADIEVEIREFVIIRGDGWADTYSWDYSDEITVSQTITAHVYDLSAERYTATYPDGDVGIGVYQALPWHGYTLSADGNDMVRGVWRYYTARDTSWDELVEETEGGSDVVTSDARPVYVHSFPSRVGPRAEPDRDGPSILDVWGIESDSPAATIHENVDVGVVDDRYTRSYGMVIRTDSIDQDSLIVQGIVRGVDAPLSEAAHMDDREIRESDVDVVIESVNDSAATLRVEVTDATTGDPIVLEDPIDGTTRMTSIGPDPRDGYLTIAGERIETNQSGMATVTVSEPGLYTAEYHPGAWYTHDPAYAGGTASVRWHPLTTVSGWLTLLSQSIWWVIPFAVSWYAGIRLTTFLQVGGRR
ncbi:Cell surface protein (plasmid) [Halalkaliarchaeum sp. AArc-CO]|nr:Cell surface protein [Halalkaliarchaeum sp. AArc-CO]